MHYQVRVRGQLSRMMVAAFPELRAQVLRSETLLTGHLPDQPALFGVLDRVEALGLDLLEVLCTEDYGGSVIGWRGNGPESTRHDPFCLKKRAFGVRGPGGVRSQEHAMPAHEAVRAAEAGSEKDAQPGRGDTDTGGAGTPARREDHEHGWPADARDA